MASDATPDRAAKIEAVARILERTYGRLYRSDVYHRSTALHIVTTLLLEFGDE